ncbi:Retrovirus-related Pol polyprotein from transposon 17.6 [Stylophora pistillata]|uniref:Retrovirus-related Pol polyprotein from transposon 17.6 n=1 Tax=Stylophora pistillata TaxID=50429 RepID=A0A2B4RHZ3_STYPI|nr:Retrovirus-related Pol polyprotein from transposon 17.6 [Stylophora pistillata]
MKVVGDATESETNKGNQECTSNARKPNKNMRRRQQQSQRGRNWRDCDNCGYQHMENLESCPALGKECLKCGKRNHFIAKCKSKEVKAANLENEEASEMYQTDVAAVELDDSQLVTLKLESGNFVRFQPDTGAQCDVMPLHIYKKASKDETLEKVTPTEASLVAYGGSKVNVIGCVSIRVWRNERPETGSASVFAVDAPRSPLTKEELMSKFPDVFGDSLGQLDGEYKIKLDETVPPVQHAPRRIAMAIRPKLKEAVDDLEAQDVVAPVTTPTRIFIPDDLYDPFGRYRWRRMPFGISSAPEVFQRKMHELIEGMTGIEVVADDFITVGYGDTFEEAAQDHDKSLPLFLQRCKERNVRLNLEKLRLRQPQVLFIGHMATDQGLGIDPAKVRAIVEMPPPTDKLGVKRLLGLAQYLAKFRPHLSDTTKPLRDLTQNDVQWVWNEPQQTAFAKLKEMVTRTPVLRYYNLKDEVTLQCDASQSGLGAALMQNRQPVAYAPRALTPAETRYAQIEKELLAIVFACDCFDVYVYGRDLVNVETNHKSLEVIFMKSLASAPKRLQRMLLHLQKYNLKVKYKKGREMLLADTLSRAYLPEVNATEFSRELEDVDHRSWLPVTVDCWEQLKNAATDDPIQQKCKASGASEFQALLDWRNTPTAGIGTSPAQRLMGRRCKTLLPVAGSLLQPNFPTEEDTRKLIGTKQRQQHHYNKQAKPLDPISVGETVRMKLPGEKTWSSGTFTATAGPRSYKAQVGQTVYRRN